MLNLTRKFNERIIIQTSDGPIIITCCSHKVSLGIDAPRNVVVHREEVWNRIKELENAKKNVS